MENVSKHRFKPHKVEAFWLKEGVQEDYWTRVTMTALRLTAWESDSDVKNRIAT